MSSVSLFPAPSAGLFLSSTGSELVWQSVPEYTLEQSYGKCRLLKEGTLVTEIDLYPTPIEGRFLIYASGAFEWAEGTTTGGGGSTDNYCMAFVCGSDGILQISRTPVS